MTVLIAGVFDFPPFTYECDNPVVPGTPYCGIEVTILKAVADALQMKLVLQTPSDGNNHWGSYYPNGTTDGLLGDVFQGTVDIGAGEFFNQVYRNELMDPSDFYNYDYFCFLLKTPPPAPEWVQLIKPFESMVWLWTLVCLVATITFLLIYSWITGLMRDVVLKGLSFYINQSTSLDVR